MHFKLVVPLLCLIILMPAPVRSSEPGSGQLQASNLLNPNISVIGWLQAETGHRSSSDQEENSQAIQLKEAELAFQAVVDPYARADIFLSASEDELEVEEGYLTWFHLPGGLGLKAGKFKANVGKFNRVHTPETAFADRPLVHDAFFGEEGLAGTGASVNWTAPIPFLFLSMDGEAFSLSAGDENNVFQQADKEELVYVGRVSSYVDLNESLNMTVGVSEGYGPAGSELDMNNSTHTLRSRVTGADITFRWKNPRRSIYRSLMWQTEFFQAHRDITSTNHVNSFGLFSHVDYQFLRRWHAGGRWDYTQSPVDKTLVAKGGLAYITFNPSEFSSISVQGRRNRDFSGENETLGFLKVTFNIGPHGAHPF